MDETCWIDIVLAAVSADAPVVSASDPLVVEKELIHTGTFTKHTDNGEVKYHINSPLLDHWHNTFAQMAKEQIAVPMPIGHTRNPEARRGTLVGTIRKPNSKGIDSLFGQVKYKNAKAKDDLSASQVSIFVPKKSGKYVMPIEHVAFTDYPVVSTLQPFNIVASYDDDESLEFEGGSPPPPPRAGHGPGPGAGGVTLQDVAAAAGIDPSITDEQAILAALLAKLQMTQRPPMAPVARQPMPVARAVPARFSHDGDDMAVQPLSGSLLGIVRENRQIRLSRLSEGVDARITPATRKVLEEQFLTDDALAFSNLEGGSSDFDAIVSALEKNPPIRNSAKTGAQAMVLSKDELSSPEKNPLVANAEKRRKEANNHN